METTWIFLVIGGLHNLYCISIFYITVFIKPVQHMNKSHVWDLDLLKAAGHRGWCVIGSECKAQDTEG